VARWTPNGTTLGDGLIQDNGTGIGINNAPVAGDMLYVNSTGGTSIYGHNTASASAIYGAGDNWIGVYGSAQGSNDVGVWGEDDAANGYGMYGYSINGTGVYGYSDAASYYGVYAYNASTGGTGLRTFGDTAASTYGTYDGIHVYAANDDGVYSIAYWGGLYGQGGVYGIYGQSAAVGAYILGGTNGAFVNATGGPGVYSTSNNAAADSDIGSTYGSYGYTTNGLYAGVYGEDDGSDGYGIWGTSTDVNGYGVYGTDYSSIGVYGGGGVYGVDAYSNTGIGGRFTDGSGDVAYLADNPYDFGGWFFDIAGDYARIGDGLDASAGVFDNTAGTYIYLCSGSSGFITNGSKSTEVKDENNQERLLFCNESPEVMFEDYGEGQLVNGKTHITLDPLFAKNVSITDKHPLRVYVQLEGDCKGVYVTNKSASGFDVKELSHGTSNVAFQWHIICNRANEAGAERNYADQRFPIGPGAPAKAVASAGPDHKLVAKATPKAPILKKIVTATATNPNKEVNHAAGRLMPKPQGNQNQ